MGPGAEPDVLTLRLLTSWGLDVRDANLLMMVALSGLAGEDDLLNRGGAPLSGQELYD